MELPPSPALCDTHHTLSEKKQSHISAHEASEDEFCALQLLMRQPQHSVVMIAHDKRH